MRAKSLIALIAVLVSVALYFFIFEEPARRRTAEENLAARRLLPYGPSDVDRLLLINHLGDSIEIVLRGEEWLMVRPVTDIADRPAIEILLQQTVTGRVLAEYGQAERLAEYGLAPPYATLILESTRQRRTDTLHVGDMAPATPRAYVRRGRSRSVVLTRDLEHNVLQKKPYHLRDKNFLHVDESDIVSLTVIAPDARLEISRSGSAWVIDSQAPGADRSMIERYVTRLAAGIIYKFAAEDQADSARFGIGDPLRHLLLRTASLQTIRISFGRRDGEFVAALSSGRDKIAMIEAGFLDVFAWAGDRVGTVRLSLAHSEHVTGISWESADTLIAYTLADGVWRAAGNLAAPVNGAAVQDLLLTLRRTVLESVADVAVESVGEIDPAGAIRIELLGATGEILDVIRIAPLPAGKWLASSLTAGTAGHLGPGPVSEIERAFRAPGG